MTETEREREIRKRPIACPACGVSVAMQQRPLCPECRGPFKWPVYTDEDIPYLLAQLREARGKLEAVEALPKGWHHYYQPTAGDEWWIEQLDRILHPQAAE